MTTTETTDHGPREVRYPSELPRAPLYVLAVDSFMSDWGHAKRRRNVLAVPCHDLKTAEQIERVLKGRSEMRYVRIRSGAPAQIPSSWMLHLMRADDMRGWRTDNDRSIEDGMPAPWIVDGAEFAVLAPDGEVVHATRYEVDATGFVTCHYTAGWSAGVVEPSGSLAFTAEELAPRLLEWRRAGNSIAVGWPDGSPRLQLECDDPSE